MNASNFVADARAAPPAVANASLKLRLATFINQTIALLMLVALLPVLLLIVLLIWCSDGLPVLFGQYRVGINGKLFRCLKFRSMRLDSAAVLAEILRTDPVARDEWARDQKLMNDPRITAVGRVLRKTSLDELPQLINVLRGEMHLVGPRPVTVGELTRYGKVRWHYVSVPPGITGLWQVSGRNNTSYDERVSLDRHYVESRSASLDAAILLKTVRVVLLREGAR